MPPELAPLVEALLAGIERLGGLDDPPGPAAAVAAAELRAAVRLSLRTKVLPELRAGAGGLPVFVGVQGGTNVGKSTVFNALAGHLLSPAVVQASATKHPLVFAHEAWRARLLEGNAFPDLEAHELEDPKSLLVDADRPELLYLRFHTDDELRDLAVIDSPDFDGALTSNLEAARRVAALSDITVWVTTAQKYRDRELVEWLRQILGIQAAVIVVFNWVDQDIVHRTLLDDLRGVAPLPADALSVRVPRFEGQHPEEDVRAVLAAPVRERLRGRPPHEVKPLLVERTLRRVLDGVRDLERLWWGELDVARRLRERLRSDLDRATAIYRDEFSLALPEQTLAARRVLVATELWPLLRLDAEVEGSRGPLRATGTVLQRGGESLRRVMLRLTGQREGTVEETPGGLEEYAASRDESDRRDVLRRAQSLRQEIEVFLRDLEPRSALARGVVRQAFGPDAARGFATRVGESHEHEVAARRSAAEDVLERVDASLERRPARRHTLRAGAIAVKAGAGLLLARVLPPSEGFLSSLFSLLAWAWFAAGWLVAAYLIALVASRLVRRERAFRKARTEAFRRVLETTLTDPLEETVGRILDENDLRAVEKAAGALEKRLGTETRGDGTAPRKPADRAPPQGASARASQRGEGR